MKKTLSVLLIVATVLLALVSCNSEQKFTEDLVSVSITSSLGKSLSGSTDFDVNSVTTWKYTAKKVNGGLTTGQTTKPVALTDNVRTQPLSQGVWDFELYGYYSSSKTNAVCYGKATNVKITTSEYTVSIVVAPTQKSTGTLVIGDIKIADSKGTTYSGDEYTQTVEVYEGKSTAGTKVELTDNKAKVSSGSYYVLVKFTGNTIGDVHQGAVVANVFDNLTTTVSGTVEEIVQAAEITKKAEKITASSAATVAVGTDGKNSAEVKIDVASTPISGDETTTTEKKTSVTFPANSLQVASSSSETSNQSVSLEITSAPMETTLSSDDYAIKDSDGAVVAGFDFDLTGVESTTFEQPVTIETYIAAGLGARENLQIAYVGTETGTAPSIDSYDTTTGKIVFKVYHFSKYAVVSTKFEATDQAGNMYETLSEALNADSVTTIYLLKNIDLGDADPIAINKSITLNLGGKTLKSTNRVFCIHSGTMIIENGTIEANLPEEKKNWSVIKVSCTEESCGTNLGLILKKDAVIKGTNSYGITAFGTHDALLNIYGTIESYNSCLAGNGSTTNTGVITMNVYEGAKLTATGNGALATTNEDSVAIYQPNAGILNIYGGEITSKNFSAVEIRAGKATISGGTLKSEASAYECKANGDGPTTKGAALAVSQHTTKLAIEVNINGGTFEGVKQLAVVNPQGNSDSDIKKVVVKKASTVTFDDVEAEAEVGDCYYTKFTIAFSGAASGSTVKILKDITLASMLRIYNAKENIIDLNGHTISSAVTPFQIQKGTVTFCGEGTIMTTSDSEEALEVAANVGAFSSAKSAGNPVVTIGKDVTLKGGDYGILIDAADSTRRSRYGANGAIINVQGKIEGSNGIYINGNIKFMNEYTPTINLEGAVIETTYSGIYAAGYAKWNLKDTTITSATPLIMKSGTVTIDGGTYTANGAYVESPTDSGNGGVLTGAVLSMTSNDSYAKKLDVVVKGGTFTSTNGYAVYEGIPNGTTTGTAVAAESYVTLDIQGGTFTGNAEKGAMSLTAMTNKSVVKVGTFNSDPTSYLAIGSTATESNGIWTVVASAASN